MRMLLGLAWQKVPMRKELLYFTLLLYCTVVYYLYVCRRINHVSMGWGLRFEVWVGRRLDRLVMIGDSWGGYFIFICHFPQKSVFLILAQNENETKWQWLTLHTFVKLVLLLLWECRMADENISFSIWHLRLVARRWCRSCTNMEFSRTFSRMMISSFHPLFPR